MVERFESHALDSTSDLENTGSFGDFLHNRRDAAIPAGTNFCEPGTAYLPCVGGFRLQHSRNSESFSWQRSHRQTHGYGSSTLSEGCFGPWPEVQPRVDRK